MADKYTKVQPKVHPLTISAVIGFFVIIIGLVIVLQPSNRKSVYNQYEAFASSYFTEDHPFYEVNYGSSLFKKGLKKIIEKEDIVVVYIGYPGCTSCQKHMGPFQRYYEELEMDKYFDQIYYYNPTKKPAHFENFMADFEGIKETTPQLVVFQDGKIIYQFEVADVEDSQALNRSVKDFYKEVKLLLDK